MDEMSKWLVKINMDIDTSNDIIEPDMIKLRYVVNADTFSEALMDAYNDIANSEMVDYSGTIVNVSVKKLRW